MWTKKKDFRSKVGGMEYIIGGNKCLLTPLKRKNWPVVIPFERIKIGRI